MGGTTRKIVTALQHGLSLQVFADQPVRKVREALCEDSQLERKSSKDKSRPTIELYLILYGSPEAYDKVDRFAISCGIFLQHPRHCDRNVLYQNPQCLSRKEGKPIFTNDLIDTINAAERQTLASLNPIELFTDNSEQEWLKEAHTPADLRTTLYKHQKQALTFMMQREEGWSLDGDHRDIWKKEYSPAGYFTYVNTITNMQQNKPPRDFRGGLLIDAPGLGKSLSIIALLAAEHQSMKHSSHQRSGTQTTLLVVPKTCE